MGRIILLVALGLCISIGAADARHRGRHWGYNAYLGSLAPHSYPGRWGRAYRREQEREFPPADWVLQPPDSTWHGRKYVSPDGDAWLAFYATSTREEPSSSHLKAVAFADGEEIGALQATARQLVVTGSKGDRLFYRKARLACAGGQWHHVAMEFPAAAQRRYAQLAARATRALDAADEDGCAGPVARD
jgi:serine/threonine-protein kinase